MKSKHKGQARKSLQGSIAAFLTVATVQTALGQEILIDFSDVAGAVSSAYIWNILGSVASSNNLLDSSGVATTVGVSFSGTINESSSAAGGWTDAAYPWLDDANLVADVFYTASGTVTLSGLSSTQRYTVELVSSRNSDASANFTLDGATPDNYPFSGSGGAFNAQTDGYTDHTLIIWEGVLPGLDGKLDLAIVKTSGAWAFINALRLTPAPTEQTTDVLIDFSDNGTAPNSAYTWNTFADIITYSNLLGSSGIPTAMSVSFSATGISESAGVKDGWTDAAYFWLDDANVVADVFLVNTSGGTMTIAGLDVTRRYTVQLVSSRDVAYEANFTLNGVTPDNDPFSGSGGAFNAQTDGYTNHTLITWQNLMPGGDGSLVLFGKATVSYGFLNALRIITLLPSETLIVVR